jgi:hypothetical protein
MVAIETVPAISRQWSPVTAEISGDVIWRSNRLKLRRHVEQLGPVQHAWRLAMGGGVTVDILAFSGMPSPDLVTLCSVGASALKGAHGELGQEFMFCQPAEIPVEEAFLFLNAFVANMASGNQHDVGLGELVEYNRPITPSWPMTTVCAFIPQHLPEGLVELRCRRRTAGTVPVARPSSCRRGRSRPSERLREVGTVAGSRRSRPL